MAAINYLDLDLTIGRTQGGYRAQVVDSPAGQASADFSVPFSDLELENFLLRMGQARRSMRRVESPETESAKTFGGRLFDAVFSADVRGCLRSSLDEADRQNAGLRIRLRLSDVPELLDLPWEYLYNSSVNRFLSLSVESPVVRYLNMPERIKPLTIKPPLKVLVMISSPSDYPPLDVDREWAKLDRAQQDPRLGKVKFVRLAEPTLAALQRCLREDEYHAFHFIGHGGFDQQAQDGVLLLQDENGRGRAVSGQSLGTLLHDERTLRLAVLNACEGARTSRTDPFAGSAQSLVQQGIPAVIGMQFEISDEAAITFSREFYAALAEQYPVDAALAEARKAIFAEGSGVEWGTPVLYLRAPDGRIFDVEQTSVPAEQVVPTPSQPVERSAPAPARDSRAVPSPVAPAASEKSGQGQRVPRRANIPWLWVGGGLAAVIVVVLLLWILSGHGESPPVVTEELTPTPTSELDTPTEAPATPMAATATVPATLSPSPNPTRVRLVAWHSVTELDGHTGSVDSVVFSPDDQWVLTASEDDTCRVWETSTWRQVAVLRGHTGSVTNVAFSRDGKYVTTASEDGTARLWEAGTWHSLGELRGHTGRVNSAVFSPDGTLIVTAGDDKVARVWDVATRKMETLLRGHTDKLTSATFSPDGKLVATASRDGTVRLWDTGTWRSLAELRGHTDRVWSAEFSPDSKLLVTGGGDELALVWDVSSRKIVATLAAHSGTVYSAAFSFDGQWIVTASANATARVWEVGTWRSLSELRGHTAEVYSAAFSHNGKFVVTGSTDDTARIWETQ